MLIFFTALMLVGIFAIPFLLPQGEEASGDVLSPTRVVGALHILTIIPFLLLATTDEEVFFPHVRAHPSVGDLSQAVALYGFYQALAFVALLMGAYSPVAKLFVQPLPVLGWKFTPLRATVAVTLSFVIGIVSFALIVEQIGGLSYLMMNLHRRAEMMRGVGYLYSALVFLILGVLVLLYSLRDRPSRLKMLLILLVALLVAAMLSSFGGRKLTMQLVILSALTWHYGVQRFRHVTIKAAFLALVIVPYFVAIPLLRSQGGFERYSQDLGELWADVRENITVAVTDLSYVNQQVLIVKYFSVDNVWWGASYADLLAAPVPSTLYPNKPPIDDGMYVRTIASGRPVTPPMSRHDLYQSSWPPETFGAMYMNFWIPGLVVGMFLLGVIYRLAYLYMHKSGYTLYSIIVYGYVLLNFHFSNLRLVQTGMTIALVSVLFILLFGFRVQRSRRARPLRLPLSSPV